MTLSWRSEISVLVLLAWCVGGEPAVLQWLFTGVESYQIGVVAYLNV